MSPRPFRLPRTDGVRKQIRLLQKRVEELEKARSATLSPAVAANPPRKDIVGHAPEVEDRGSMQDLQQAAPRFADLTFNPKYRGFFD